MNSKLEEYLQERVQDFSETYLKVDPRTVKTTFPWGRLFETDITVYDKPVVPLQKEIRMQREAEAKRQAEGSSCCGCTSRWTSTSRSSCANSQQPQAAPAATSTTVVHQASTSPRIVPTPVASASTIIAYENDRFCLK